MDKQDAVWCQARTKEMVIALQKNSADAALLYLDNCAWQDVHVNKATISGIAKKIELEQIIVTLLAKANVKRSQELEVLLLKRWNDYIHRFSLEKLVKHHSQNHCKAMALHLSHKGQYTHAEKYAKAYLDKNTQLNKEHMKMLYCLFTCQLKNGKPYDNNGVTNIFSKAMKHCCNKPKIFMNRIFYRMKMLK